MALAQSSSGTTVTCYLLKSLVDDVMFYVMALWHIVCIPKQQEKSITANTVKTSKYLRNFRLMGKICYLRLSCFIIGYRRWLLGKLFEEICLEDSDASDAAHHCNATKSSSITRGALGVGIASHSDLRHCVVVRELSACHTAADRYHSNYNAWNHRIWMMNNFTCCRIQVCIFRSTNHTLWLLLPHKKMQARVASESTHSYRTF